MTPLDPGPPHPVSPTGPLADFYRDLAGQEWVDWVVQR